MVANAAGNRNQRQCNLRQLCIQPFVEGGKLRNNHSHQVSHQHDQQHGKDNRIGDCRFHFAPCGIDDALILDIAADDFFQVATFLSSIERRGVHLGEHSLRLESFRKQGSRFDASADVREQLLKVGILHPLREEVQRLENRKTGMNQG